MARKNVRNTRGKIVNAAWNLFYDQGYENTTVEDIIESSQTSKGSFYHYFSGKEALLSTLSDVFDERYEELSDMFQADMSAMDKLLFLNKGLFGMIENRISIDLLARLLSVQLITNEEKQFLGHKRFYYKLLRKIISEGQDSGQLNDGFSVSEMVKLYALCERGILYDWCLCGGEYSLSKYSTSVLPTFLACFLSE